MTLFNIKNIRAGLLFISITTVVLIFFFISTNKNERTILDIENLDKGIDVKIDNAIMVEDNSNDKQWELRTDSAEINHADDIALLKKVSMNIFQADNSTVNISANSGTVTNRQKDVEMKGDVVISGDKYTLTTEKLHWSSETKKAKTDVAVNIAWGNFTVSGEGLVFDLDSQKLELKNKVAATFNLPVEN